MKSSGRRFEGDCEVIGVIPAAGWATRLPPLPFSKELTPVGFQHLDRRGGQRPKVIAEELLKTLQVAGVKKAFIILRDGKWDIPAYFGDGGMVEMHFAYLLVGSSYGVPYTVDQAYPFIRDAIVAFGFPDILFRPRDAFSSLLRRQSEEGADVVLGLFHTDDPQKADMVEIGHEGRIKQILVKPKETDLTYAWVIAVWTHVFTEFMHQFLMEDQRSRGATSSTQDQVYPEEIFIGEVIQAGIESAMKVVSVVFERGKFIDVGTPEGLAKVFPQESSL